MGNQQPSTIIRACINAKLGDGTYWKHPECRNYKLIWSSIDKDWILWKRANLLPKGLVGSMHKNDRRNDHCFANAKPIYTLASRVDPLFTQWKELTEQDALAIMDVRDLAIWYLDDGCLHHRKDSRSHRVIMSIGRLNEVDIEPLVVRLFGTRNYGRVCLNNSRATINNKSWIVPKPIALQVINEARKFAPPSMQRKVELKWW